MACNCNQTMKQVGFPSFSRPIGGYMGPNNCCVGLSQPRQQGQQQAEGNSPRCCPPPPQCCSEAVKAKILKSPFYTNYETCNRFATREYEQDQWRDYQWPNEKDIGREYNSFRATRFTPKAKGGQGQGETVGNPDVDECGCWYPPKKKFIDNCHPCDVYQQKMRALKKWENDNPGYCHPRPIYPCCNIGRLNQKYFSEKLDVLKKLNKDMQPAPSSEPRNLFREVLSEMGESPIITLHKLGKKREDASGMFYPEERGLARVCCPTGGSYLTARPFRCNPIYRDCEPVNCHFSGHVPGEQFVYGKVRAQSTKNSLKSLSYCV